MKSNYTVAWYIDVEADSMEDAAAQAFELMHGEDSTATCFDVYDMAVDYPPEKDDWIGTVDMADQED